jgi:FkbM family methyltransferase
MNAMVELLPPPARVAKRAFQAWLGGEPELRLLPRLCRRDEAALDVGANYGVYTWHLRRSAAEVVAFEPQPVAAAFLRRAFGSRVRIEEVALSDEAGEVVLRVPNDRMLDGCATIEPSNALADIATSAVRVPRRRLDDYGFGRVGLIKIDVEGHELAVMRGGAELIARDRPSLVVEAEDRHRPGALSSVYGHLRAVGYRGLFLRDGRLLPLEELAFGAGDGLGARAAARGINNFIFIGRHDLLAELVG